MPSLPPTAPPPPPPRRKRRVLIWLRDSFLAGVAIILPFAVTIWLLWSFVRFVDLSLAPLTPAPLAFAIRETPGFGVIVALFLLTILGALAGNWFGRLVVREGERIVLNLPIVRSIYGGAKQVFHQVATPERQSFKEAVLIEWPTPGLWTIGFVTNDAPQEMLQGLPEAEREGLVAVYVPQAPIPTTGFICYAPRAKLRPIDLGAESALKRVLSLGMVKPEEGDQPKP